MDNIGISILGILAVVGHVVVGYYCMFKPSVLFLKERFRLKSLDIQTIHTQEILALLVCPMVGYALWFFFKEMVWEEFIRMVPALATLQLLAFSSYFLCRQKIGTRNYFIRMAYVCLMVVGLLSCIFLIYKLFYYYLVCITLGWIFIIPPIAALSYYALIQAIVFLSVAIKAIIAEDSERNMAYGNITSFDDLYYWLFSGARGVTVYSIVICLFIAGVWFLLCSNILAPFNLSWDVLTTSNNRF